MRKNNKIFGLIACSAVLAGAVSLGAANVNVAPAAAEETPVTFEVAQQAQVKYGEEGGIRFAATISKSHLDTFTGTVKLVSSIDKAGNTDAGEAITYEWDVTATYKTGYDTNTYYHAISFADAELDVKAAAAVELTATMWLEADGKEVANSRQSVTRSMRAVANAVYDAAGDNQTELDKYFGERKTAKAAYKEVGDATQGITDSDWVVDGGAVITPTAAYEGATLVEIPAADGTAGTSIGKSYALFDAEYNVYNVSDVTYVTKAIAEASDIEVFDFTLEKAGYTEEGQKTTTVTAWTLDGYYVLASDVDARAYVIHHLGFDKKNSAGLSYFYALKKSGFVGTFEGNGHKLKATVSDYGLFGAILKGATIQNLGLELFLTSGTTTRVKPSLLAYLITGGADIAVNNIYIKPHYTDGFDETKGNVCLSQSVGNVNLDWTVVDWSDGYRFNPVTKTGALLTIIDSTSNYASMNRVFFICDTNYNEGPMPIFDRTDISGYTYAYNDKSDTCAAQIGTGTVYRYDDYETMFDTFTDNQKKKFFKWRKVDGVWMYEE